MAVGDVFYPAPTQIELPAGGLAQIYQITAGRTALQVTIVVCCFSIFDTGYDLKVRPEGEVSANKHFWRASATALNGKLRGGNTEVWRLHIRPGEEWIVEGEAEQANAIAVTFSPAEMEDPT